MNHDDYSLTLENGKIILRSNGKTTTIGTAHLLQCEELHPFQITQIKQAGKSTADYFACGQYCIRKTHRPILTELIAAARAAAAQESATAAAHLESACPGVGELRRLRKIAAAEDSRHSREFEKMMADEMNDGVNPPRPRDNSAAAAAAFSAAHPRAALYLRAEKQAEGTSSYSATSGMMKGGDDAKQILLAGGTLEEAEKALAFRYENLND